MQRRGFNFQFYYYSIWIRLGNVKFPIIFSHNTSSCSFFHATLSWKCKNQEKTCKCHGNVCAVRISSVLYVRNQFHEPVIGRRFLSYKIWIDLASFWKVYWCTNNLSSCLKFSLLARMHCDRNYEWTPGDWGAGGHNTHVTSMLCLFTDEGVHAVGRFGYLSIVYPIDYHV